MDSISIVGLDLAKRVFQVHGVRADGHVVFRKKLSRGQLMSFFADLPPCIVAMEACATSNYWAREIGALGHEIRLVPPQDSIATTIGGSFWKNSTISLRRSFLRKTGCSAAFTPCS